MTLDSILNPSSWLELITYQSALGIIIFCACAGINAWLRRHEIAASMNQGA